MSIVYTWMQRFAGKLTSAYRGEEEVISPTRLDASCLAKARRRIEEIVAENIQREFVQKAARDEIKRFQKDSDGDARPVEETATAKPNASSKDSGMRFSVSSGCRWSVGRSPDLSYDHLIQISLSSRHVPPNVHAKKLTFSALLLQHVRNRCGGKAAVAYKRAGIDRKLYSKIISYDDSTCSKITALQFAIGLQLSVDETVELLKSAGYALSDTVLTDQVFRYCIENQIWNILDVNQLLSECHLHPLNVRF